MPERIQLSRRKGWRLPANTVKVDRTNKVYGNPFAIYATHFAMSDGSRADRWSVEGAHVMFETKREAAEYAVTKFRDRIMHEQMATFRGNAAVTLRGKNLACWCRLDEPCHADVLLELANAPNSTASGAHNEGSE